MQPTCKCPIQPGMTFEQLRDDVVPHNCAGPQFICPNLDRTLREADAARSQRIQYERQLRRKGMTQDQIDNRRTRSTTRNTKMEAASLEL